ncbi:MAG: SPASM domain-containing protein, partial [Anaerolineae bacterium]|nr:SPASM domain-containing protein [Anaerolineae bacterium]
PCIELRIPGGNIRQRRFIDIWNNGGIFKQLRSRHTMKNLPECHVCPINRYCEGRCSGLAWKEHGDLYGGHSLACSQAQARFAQIHPNQMIPETPLQARLRRGEITLVEPTNGQPIVLVDSFVAEPRPQMSLVA